MQTKFFPSEQVLRSSGNICLYYKEKEFKKLSSNQTTQAAEKKQFKKGSKFEESA